MTDEWKEIKALLIKTALPILMGLSIKLAILSKKENLTIKRGIIASVCGVVAVYLTYPILVASVSETWLPCSLAIVAMSGEKIGSYLIYDMNVKNLLDLFNFLSRKK